MEGTPALTMAQAGQGGQCSVRDRGAPGQGRPQTHSIRSAESRAACRASGNPPQSCWNWELTCTERAGRARN
eukprot:1666956-Prymnesium_polylepis.1